MVLEEVLLVSAAALLLVYAFKTRHENKNGKRSDAASASPTNIPTVSPCLPYFGNALHLDMAKCHLMLAEFRQKYGPVFKIRLYKEEIVVLNDYASIHDALVVKGSDFAGRPPMYRTKHAGRNKHSIVWQTHTKKLVFLRKVVLKSLRMYGSGLEMLERRCEPDILCMCERMAAQDGQAFNPWNVIYDSVCSVMLSLTLGIHLDYSSPDFQRLKRINYLFNDTFGAGRARRLDFLPLLRWIKDDCYCRMQEALALRDEFWAEQYQKLKEDDHYRDCLVQDLLHEVNTSPSTAEHNTAASSSLSSSSAPSPSPSSKSSSPSSASSLSSTTTPPSAAEERKGSIQRQDSSQPDISITTVKEVFTNLILAGTDTTATTLTCFLLVLLHNPDVQRRMQEEVDRVIGHSRSACLADRPAMPYVEAVLMELLRYISHVPLAVPHYTTRDTSVLNMHVPANTTVYINLWCLHHDESEWDDPWVFDPNRFLDNQGQLVPPSHPNRRKWMPFGAGRRVCLGEVLAKNRLFLFAASLVQKFSFEAEDSENLPDVDPRSYEMGLVLHPKPFRLRAVLRN